jgi:hypothetical protein
MICNYLFNALKYYCALMQWRIDVEFVRTFWPVILGFITFLAWLVRLEARSLENEREIKRLWNQRKEDLEASRIAREDTNAMLAEIRDDIKALIAKVGK